MPEKWVFRGNKNKKGLKKVDIYHANKSAKVIKITTLTVDGWCKSWFWRSIFSLPIASSSRATQLCTPTASYSCLRGSNTLQSATLVASFDEIDLYDVNKLSRKQYNASKTFRVSIIEIDENFVHNFWNFFAKSELF